MERRGGVAALDEEDIVLIRTDQSLQVDQLHIIRTGLVMRSYI